MYKYKQTTDAEVGDLVLWTELLPNNPHITKNKVYKVLGKINNSLVTVLSDNNTEINLGKAQGFKVLQTKSASEAVVGDYMYRVSSGNTKFPQYSIMKITKIDAKSNISNLYYTSTSSVSFIKVIVVAQAEPEVKYPLFMQWKATKVIVKFDGFKSGTQLTKDTTYNAGVYRTDWFIHSNTRWEPCDFTIEPEIFDIDWWQGRFEAGLPVFVNDLHGTHLCVGMGPKTWKQEEATVTFNRTDPSLTQKSPLSKEDIELFKSANEWKQVSLGSTTDCSLPYPTIKEQPMNKTTLKLLLELLGASEEVKDATNSKFVGIITNEDEYVGYMYFDSKEDATECMAQPRMELHKLHLFEKSCVLAQKPRKVIEL